MKKFLILFLFFVSSVSFLVKNPCSSFSRKEFEGLNKEAKKASASELDEREYRVTVQGVIFDRITQNPIVILLTEDEKRFVPIWIGFSEAMSIDMVIKNIKPPRPMTHDLVKDIFEKFGAKVEKVSIVDVRNNTYYAVIKVRANGKTFLIDSRPSDAIAIALRTGTPIYITQKILEVSIKIPDEEKVAKIWNIIGVSLQLITPELESFFGSKGLVISDVKRGSVAEGKLKRGDIITQVNGKSVIDERAFSIIKNEILNSRVLEVTVLRDGEKRVIKIELPKH